MSSHINTNTNTNTNKKANSQSNKDTDLDLDINNYTVGDLILFFKLNKNYTNDELYQKEREITINVLSTDDKIYSTSYKYEIIEFIKTAKALLGGKFSTTNNTMTNNDDDVKPAEVQTTNNIGKILNPLANHPALERQSIKSNYINGYNNITITTNYLFNTQFRDDYFSSIPSHCNFTLPIKIKNIAALTLTAVQVPYTFLAFQSSQNTNEIYIYEDGTGLNGIVTIPDGNYDYLQYPLILETAINTQILGSYPNRFKVTISDYTRFTTISNTTNTFTMNILKNDNQFADFMCKNSEFTAGFKIDYNDAKQALQPSILINTMGYLIGYRKPVYVGSQSYTSESVFNSRYDNYVYFCLEDYGGSQAINNIGILPNGLINQNILGIIPLTSPTFTSTLSDGANFIVKTRKYLSPINIQKISIKMVNKNGEIINLNGADFSFVLQTVTLYDPFGDYPKTTIMS